MSGIAIQKFGLTFVAPQSGNRMRHGGDLYGVPVFPDLAVQAREELSEEIAAIGPENAVNESRRGVVRGLFPHVGDAPTPREADEEFPPDFLAAINDGTFRREIDEAVGNDPQLTC